jgi:hypothetical protein
LFCNQKGGTHTSQTNWQPESTEFLGLLRPS